MGSSNDHPRIIRHAYHSPAYTALTRAAYDSWADVENRTGLRLVTRTGGLDLFPEESGEADLQAYEHALNAAAIPYELLDTAEVRARFPQWRLDDGVRGMYQADGGILDLDGPRITVHTDRGTVQADPPTLATGSWAGELLPYPGAAWPSALPSPTRRSRSGCVTS